MSFRQLKQYLLLKDKNNLFFVDFSRETKVPVTFCTLLIFNGCFRVS